MENHKNQRLVPPSQSVQVLFGYGRKALHLLWLLAVAIVVVYGATHPELFTAENLVAYMQRFNTGILIAYTAVSMLRGFFMIPSTPFVVGGVLLFPELRWAVFGISLTGVMLAAVALYFYANGLGFSHFLEKKYPRQVAIWKQRLAKPRSAVFVFAWAFLPLVPTEIICYVAGLVKMPFKYFFISVLLGEALLVGAFVFGTNWLFG